MQTGVIIAIVGCCCLVILAIVLGVYFSGATCPDFGNECAASPAPSANAAARTPAGTPSGTPVGTPIVTPRVDTPALLSLGTTPDAAASSTTTPTTLSEGAQPEVPWATPTTPVTTFTSSTTPSQVVAALQAASPNGLINLGNVQYATPEQHTAATQAYLAQCQVGEYQKTPCNAPCGGTGIAVWATGRIGGGTANCPAETTRTVPCTGLPCVAPPPPSSSAAACVVEGYVGRYGGRPCCDGSNFDDGYCYL